MTISPFARWLISTYDWRTAMLVIGIVAWTLLLPAALLVRRPPAPAASAARRPASLPTAPASRRRRRSALRNSWFSGSRSSRAARRIPGRSFTW